MEDYKQNIKDSIKQLVDSEKLSEANELLNQYQRIVADDIEIYSIKAVIAIMENNLADAKQILRQGLEIDSSHFDLLCNLAYVYEVEQKYDEVSDIFFRMKAEKLNDDQQKYVEESINRIEQKCKNFSILKKKDKQKLIFFVKQGLDSFLGDILEGLSGEYETKKVIVNELIQIDEGMKWADICWFEWCDELVAYGSKVELSKTKQIICRLHSYEAFTDYPINVNWANVDKVIFIAKHIRDNVLKKVSSLKIEQIAVIPNGIDLKKYNFKPRKIGFNIAYVGYLNYKKGTMLLLHTFKAIFDKDNRYKLYIAGNFQDEREVLYYKQMIVEMGLERNVIYDGWQDNLNKWLDDKNYILCTSLLESQNMSVMQAMAKGIKPLVHNFVGCKLIYPEKYVWNCYSDIFKIIEEQKYNSQEYRAFIENRYSLEQMNKSISNYIAVESQKGEQKEKIVKPLVSVCITSYNYEKYLERAINSVVNQNYENMELIIIDDCSSDRSPEIIKKYSSKYAYIKGVYNKKNEGYRYGITRFISEWCMGKYFIILSADDMLATDETIARFVNAHETCSNSMDFIYGDQILIDNNSNPVNTVQFEHFEPEEVVKETFLRFGSGVLPILFAMHRIDFYRANHYTWEEINGVANDTLNSLIAMKRGAKYSKLNYPMIKYRQHDENMTFNLEVRLRDLYGIIDYVIENFDEKYYITSEFISEDEETQKQLKCIFLIKYYYAFIMHYYLHYKVYGIWELKISKAEKLMYLIAFKNRCFHYLNAYLDNEYVIHQNFVLQVKEDLTKLYEE